MVYFSDECGITEDYVKNALKNHFENNNWTCEIAWGTTKGIDILATKNNEHWIIEVKGGGSLTQMRGNYFLAVLGEILQRMENRNTKYSIAFPAMQRYKKLWDNLPQLAKERLNITCFFVDKENNVIEVT
jgi:hypothetical protein